MGLWNWLGLRGGPARVPAIAPVPAAPTGEERSAPAPRPRSAPRRAVRSFAMGDENRLTEGWNPSGVGVNEALRSRLYKMRLRGRDLCINNDYGRRFKRLCATNLVGPMGIALQAQAREPDGRADEAANRLVEAGWAAWGKRGSCDVTGNLSWVDAQRLAAGIVPQDGELLVLLVSDATARNPEGLAIQVLESDALPIHLCRQLPNGNRIVMGVELTPYLRPVAYWLTAERDTNATLCEWGGKYERYPADRVIHLFVPEFPGQVRGIPWTHSAGVRLNQVAAYEDSEVVASRVGASKMGFITPGDDYDGGDDEPELGDLRQEVEPGVLERLPRGVTVSTFDPQHPNGGFASFVKRCLMGVAAGLGVSYPTLASDLEGVNYSSGRLGTLDERDMWMALQAWLADTLCQRVFDEWLPRALLAGTVALPPEKLWKFGSVRWQPRRWAWVDPLKDMIANTKAIDARLKSRRQIVEEQGGDWDAVVVQLAEEEKKLSSLGLLSPKPAPAPEE